MTGFTIYPIRSIADLANIQLIRTVLGESDGVDVMVRRILAYRCDFSWDNFLTVRDNDRMVASLNIISQTWSIGGITIKVAEMGMVATLLDYRKKGLRAHKNIRISSMYYSPKAVPISLPDIN